MIVSVLNNSDTLAINVLVRLVFNVLIENDTSTIRIYFNIILNSKYTTSG